MLLMWSWKSAVEWSLSPSAAVIRLRYFSMFREVQLREVSPGRMASSTLATCAMSSCSKAGWILDLTLEFSDTINWDREHIMQKHTKKENDLVSKATLARAQYHATYLMDLLEWFDFRMKDIELLSSTKCEQWYHISIIT